MSNEHESPAPERRPWLRWRYRAPAAVGLAVILGSSLLAAQQGGSKHATAGADLPAGPAEASQSAAAASADASASASAGASATASAPASPAASRSPSKRPAAPASVPPVTITTTGSLPK